MTQTYQPQPTPPQPQAPKKKTPVGVKIVVIIAIVVVGLIWLVSCGAIISAKVGAESPRHGLRHLTHEEPLGGVVNESLQGSEISLTETAVTAERPLSVKNESALSNAILQSQPCSTR